MTPIDYNKTPPSGAGGLGCLKRSVARYYDRLHHGEHSMFIVVVSHVVGGSEVRWRKNIKLWQRGILAGRRMHSVAERNLEGLLIEDKWREVYKRMQSDKTLLCQQRILS